MLVIHPALIMEVLRSPVGNVFMLHSINQQLVSNDFRRVGNSTRYVAAFFVGQLDYLRHAVVGQGK